MSRKAAFLVLAAVVLLGCRGARAQGRLSPHERTPVVTVNGSEMFIEYGRPSVRGRQIFGSLVRYDDVWCPGADQCTYLSTSKPLRIGNLAVPAGKYSLWILPTEDVWTLIISTDWEAFHTSYRSRYDLGRVKMQKEKLPANVEQLTFTIEPNAAAPGGRIAMAWATTKVSGPFTVE